MNTQPELFALDEILARNSDSDSSDEDSSCSTTECSTSSEEEDFDSLDECLEAYSLAEYIRSQNNPNKRQRVDDYVDKDMHPLAFVRFNTSLGKPKPVTIKVLLDSGPSESLINKKHVSKLRVKSSNKTSTVWSTPGVDLHTNSKVKGQFTIPELQDKKLIKWNLHVAENMGAYHMIIGRDILSFLKIDIRFSNQVVMWDGSKMPFKPVEASVTTDYHIAETMAMEDQMERIKKILDAKYSATDLEKVCSSQSHLELEKQQKLLTLLKRFEDLFDGMLGKWNEESVKLELKEDATPYHARPFPIPRCHAETLKMEVDRLVEIGVLKKVNRSKWAAPSFIIPKKDGTVRFINDFRELNKRIKRKPFPIPNIQDMLLNLERFQYATSLDLNMGYYNIKLCPDSKKLCTLVFPFRK
jgi:hypothetical protein